jgi:hypothetical protein
MTLASYRKKSPLRRAFCHILPFCFAVCIGALAIMAFDRNSPAQIVWGKIIPPIVVAGQPIEFHFDLIKFSDYGGTLKRWVTDAHGQVYPIVSTPTVSAEIKETGVEQEITKKFAVPCGIAVGEAAYHSTASVYSWWNIVQRFFPVDHNITYPFTVKFGTWAGACAANVTQ